MNSLPHIVTWRLRCGTEVSMRRVVPTDAAGLGKLVSRLSPKARRERFHGAVSSLSDERLKQMSSVDQQRHVAFVMTEATSGCEQIVADARYVVDHSHTAVDGTRTAEFAVVVDERWQRRGLGTRAIAALSDAARSADLGWLHGRVLAQNVAMLALLRQCDFFCTVDREDDSMMCAEASLANGPWVPKRSLTQRAMFWTSWQKPAWPNNATHGVNTHA